MSKDANDLIMGGGVEAAKFVNIGDFVQGPILRIGEKTQVRKFKKDGIGDLDFWDDGTEKWQVRIDLQTELRDPTIPHDDGIRGVYVPAGKNIRTAIQTAVKAAGEREIKVGAILGVQMIGEEDNGTNNPTKLFRAVYTPPPAAGSGMIMDGGGQQNVPAMPQMNQPVPQATPAQPVPQMANQPMQQAMQPMSAPTPPAPTAEQLAQFAAWQASQVPATTMQHPLGQAGMQQPAPNPAEDPKVAQLLANVANGQQ